jgi:hypothetical protein
MDCCMTTNPTFQVDHDKIEYELDELLSMWFLWQKTYSPTRGFSGRDGTCRDYRSPGHWDWKNGAADARADDLVVRAVDVAIGRIPNMPQPWNTALQMEARNCATGNVVWSSPRLPKGEELEVLVREARNMLLRELRRAGVMT